ncbi:MAG: KH domain-containing protein [Chloroflexi bacterium]|nr:KH domain-containing protein [Chloroflexota bacterium]
MASAKDLVEFIAKSLVDDPSQVRVSEIGGGASLILELRVGSEDMGRVIGRGGRTANAIRTLTRVLADRHGRRVTLEIV